MPENSEQQQQQDIEEPSQKNEGISYNQAIEYTLNDEPKSPPLSTCRRIFTLMGGSCGIFQLTLVCVYLVVANTYDPTIYGLGFLEKEPNRFECQEEITAEDGSTHAEWRECTKQEICEKGLSKDQYRPDRSDDEYIDNWVSPDKFNLLCEPKWKIGLLGSMFFIGVVATMLVLPPLSDAYGRRYTFLFTLVLSIIAQLGLILTTNLYWAYAYQFMNGVTFTGKCVVGLTYTIEFMIGSHQKAIVLAFMLSESIALILITFWYQFIDRRWLLLQVLLLVAVILGTVYYFFLVPESPKWLYIRQQYEKSRQRLVKVAKYNAVDDEGVERIQTLKYDLEVIQEKERIAQQMENVPLMMGDQVQKSDTAKSQSVDSFKDGKISRSQYYQNLAKMTVFWTASSFSFYLLQAMTKDFEGNLFINYYLDGAAGVVGLIIAQPLYDWLQMKIAFILSTSLTLLFGTLLLVFEEGYASTSWMEEFGCPKSGQPQGSKGDEDYHLRILIPIIVFAVKIAINISFLNSYQCSFNENCIFPFYKRATSIGICNFVARVFTVASPLVAELDRPIPAFILLGVNFLAFIVAFTLPSSEEQREFDLDDQMSLEYSQKKSKQNRT